MDDMMKDVPESVRMDAAEPESAAPEASGRTIHINCYEDGTYDVFEGAFVPGSESEHPNGLFGLDSIEDALKAVIALKGQGKDYSEAEDEAMLGAFGGREEEA